MGLCEGRAGGERGCGSPESDPRGGRGWGEGSEIHGEALREVGVPLGGGRRASGEGSREGKEDSPGGGDPLGAGMAVLRLLWSVGRGGGGGHGTAELCRASGARGWPLGERQGEMAG